MTVKLLVYAVCISIFVITITLSLHICMSHTQLKPYSWSPFTSFQHLHVVGWFQVLRRLKVFKMIYYGTLAMLINIHPWKADEELQKFWCNANGNLYLLHLQGGMAGVDSWWNFVPNLWWCHHDFHWFPISYISTCLRRSQTVWATFFNDLQKTRYVFRIPANFGQIYSSISRKKTPLPILHSTNDLGNTANYPTKDLN